MPLLTPIGLDPAHPFPRVYNKSLNFIVSLSGADAFGRQASIAVVQAPRALPRLIKMPPELSGHPEGYILLTSLLRASWASCSPAWRCWAATSGASRATATCSWTRKKSPICAMPCRASCRSAISAPPCGSRSTR